MTYILKVYQYDKQTQTLKHTNTITDTNNEHANKELAKIFVDKNVRGTKTKISYNNNPQNDTNTLYITQTWIGATKYDQHIGGHDYKIVVKYEYTFYDCTL